MKRYHVPFDQKTLEDKCQMSEHPMGSWVLWTDAHVEIERLRRALNATLPAVEEMIQQAAPRQKDHWHKILVEASTATDIS